MCPLLDQSPVSLECCVVKKLELGVHDMFLAEIVAVHAEADLLDEDGKLHLERAGLIAYSHGDYVEPVSYTHLDVYKRQTFGCMIRKAGASAAEKGPPHRISPASGAFAPGQGFQESPFGAGKEHFSMARAYLKYLLSLLIFGTNGIVANHISLSLSLIHIFAGDVD